MCIGIPMQVVQCAEGTAVCRDEAGELHSLRTSLLERGLAVGDWVLTYLHDAVERLTPERAQEVLHTLALVRSAMLPPAALDADDVHPARAAADFDLPSRLRAEDLAALTGA